jgi:hypothetical protein
MKPKADVLYLLVKDHTYFQRADQTQWHLRYILSGETIQVDGKHLHNVMNRTNNNNNLHINNNNTPTSTPSNDNNTTSNGTHQSNKERQDEELLNGNILPVLILANPNSTCPEDYFDSDGVHLLEPSQLPELGFPQVLVSDEVNRALSLLKGKSLPSLTPFLPNPTSAATSASSTSSASANLMTVGGSTSSAPSSSLSLSSSASVSSLLSASALYSLSSASSSSPSSSQVELSGGGEGAAFSLSSTSASSSSHQSQQRFRRKGFQVTNATKLVTLFCRYRFVFSLDISPSIATIDNNTGQVLFSSIYPCLERALNELAPFELVSSCARSIKVSSPSSFLLLFAHITSYSTQPSLPLSSFVVLE